jgi:asparagine synthase (glutamine-hydrolysing)
MRYARRKILGASAKDSMNPFNYWYKTNRGLREVFETYFQENLNLLDGHSQLQKDTELLFEDGSSVEKTQALTLLAALKLHKLKI